jgi:hypothetical protein
MSRIRIVPVARATRAPAVELQPMPSPLGCQMTRTRVTRKIRRASRSGLPEG